VVRPKNIPDLRDIIPASAARSFVRTGLALLCLTVLPACFNAELVWEAGTSELLATGSGSTSGSAASAITFSNSQMSVIPASQLAAVSLSGSCQENGSTVVLSGAASATTYCVAAAGTGAWNASVNLNGATDGLLTLTATTVLADGTSASTDLNVIKDTQAPSIPAFGASPSSTVFADRLQVSWSCSENGLAGWDASTPYLITLYGAASCTGAALNTITATSTPAVLTGLSDGINYSWTVTARDAAGNLSVSACSSSAFVDLSVPSLAITAPTGYSSNTAVTVATGNISAGVAGYCLTEQAAAPASGTAACSGGQGASNGWHLAAPTSFTLSGSEGAKTLRLWVKDVHDNVKAGATDSIVLDRTAPSLALTSLTGGQSVVAGAAQNITWTAADANALTVSLAYSTNGGATWTAIASGQPNSGSYSWTPPAVDTATARVRVSATDAAGNSVVATSSSDFSIATGAPSLSHSLTGYNATAAFPGAQSITVLLTNTSSALPITLGAVSQSSALFVVSGGTCGATLAASASCTIVVSVSPDTVGTVSGAMTVPYTSAAQATTQYAVSMSYVVSVGTVSVAAVYPANGANWNDYVVNASPSLAAYKQADTACVGTETAGYSGCVHGGELRKAVLTGVSSCASLTASDSLGALDWVCEADSGVAKFYSTGLVSGARLSTLLNADSWRDNSLTVRKAGVTVMQSAASPWWGNEVLQLALPGNYVVPSGVGDIFTVTGAGYQITHGVAFASDKQSLVVFPGSTLRYSGGGLNCGASTGTYSALTDSTIVCAGKRFLWIEGDFEATPPSGTDPDDGVFMVGANMSVLHHVSVHGADSGIYLSSGLGLRFNQVQSVGSNISGIEIYATRSLFEGIRSSHHALNGILLYSSGNAFKDVNVSGNGDNGLMVVPGANGNRFTDLRSSGNVSNSGINIQSYDNVLTRVLAVGNSVGLYISSNGRNNTVHQITASQNYAEGIGFDGASAGSNLISGAVLSNNGYGVLLIGGSSANRFLNIVAAHNDTGIFLNSSSSNHFAGYLGVSNNASQQCSVIGGTNPGLTNACAQQGASSFTFRSPGSLAASWVGRVTSDDSINTSDTSGAFTGPRASVTDWLGFSASTRLWAPDAPDYLTATGRGQCGVLLSSVCRIWDYALRATDSVLLDRGGDGSTINGTWTDGGACPADLNGNLAVSDAATSGARPFLKHAVEHVGDDDGLCQSGETCLYAPNAGYYLGDGDPTGHACTFSNGLVTGVTMLRYPTNGR
jgi:hypothetical protein